MIAQELFRKYKRALATNDAMAREELMQFLTAIAEQTSEYDEIRDALLDGFPALVAKYGNRAGEVAAEFYAAQRAASLGANVAQFVPEVAASTTLAILQDDVRYAATSMYAGRPDAMVSLLAGMLTRRVYMQADDTIKYGISRDPAEPTACFVPAAGACSWCLFIAALGFTRSEKALESMRHHDCRCTLVVDFKDPKLQGYDPVKYEDIYYDANTDENKQVWRDQWDAMSDAEREKYENVNHFMRNQMVAEMGRINGA